MALQPILPDGVQLTSAVDAASAASFIPVQNMQPQQARLWNASRPVSDFPNPAAAPFVLKTDSKIDETHAVDCMTAAIYYEAAYEGLDGQRAVAQVVLNRMRHPAFPKSVCNVVFQGSERSTGCQFTFTCDGSLTRKPNAEVWSRARAVAEAALNGYVMKSVGLATHYHADYVAPYWSPTLVKVSVIGAHIFYRWSGGMGQPPAFSATYAGGEARGMQLASFERPAGQFGAAPSAPIPEPAMKMVAAPVLAAAAEPTAAAAAPVVVVTPVALAENTAVMVKAENLDWKGQPRQNTVARIALPSSMGPPAF